MYRQDALKHLDEKTQNMEYSYREGVITLCLWANIHRAVRRRGMSRLGFRFWIPTDLAEEDCVIRLMRVEFVPSLPELEMTQREEKDSSATELNEISYVGGMIANTPFSPDGDWPKTTLCAESR
ncbi:protein CASC1 [Trichonephila clavipes]|nr:protein CASC1 [Trichonephila clavipes]